MIYYKNLKRLFEGSGYTYKKLGEELGIHWVTLNRLANAENCDEYNLSLKSIDRICTYFNAPLGDLLEFSQEKKAGKKRPRTKAVK